MRFLQPGLFYGWVALIAVPLILYLFRPRPRTVRTSTLPFFMWLAKEHQDNAWLRRLKQLLSLLMTLGVIMAGVSSLGQLVVAPSEDDLETVVVLIDRSASMSARQDDESPTRMDEALRLVRERVAGLPAGVGVSVIAYDRAPEVLMARTVDRRQVLRTLDQVVVRPVGSEAEPALRLAKRLAALETPAAVWHVTDYKVEHESTLIGDSKPDADSNDEPSTQDSANASEDGSAGEGTARELDLANVDVKTFEIGLPQPLNAGLTAFKIRRVPLQQARLGYEAFVQVRSNSSEEVEAELEVRYDGELVQLRKLTIKPEQSETLLIPIDAELAKEDGADVDASGDTEGNSDQNETNKPASNYKVDSDRTLTLKLNVEGDVLAEDNILHAWIPNLPPIRILWLTEKPDPFIELAFSTISTSADIQMLQGSPSTWPPKEPVDVVIFDGWVPKEWPTDVEVIAIRPSGAVGPINAVPIPNDGVPIENLREAESDHPLLYGVATERISLRQRVVLDATGPLQPIWSGPSGPVLVAGESQGQRVIVMAFSPEQSERFPLMTSFPIFLANSIYWAAENRIGQSLGINRRTGELQQFDGDSLEWSVLGEDNKPQTESLDGEWAELSKIGLWKTNSGQRGSAALLSTKETLLPRADDDTETKAQEETGSASWFRGDLVPLLMWSMFVLLLLDSWLYHRHAV